MFTAYPYFAWPILAVVVLITLTSLWRCARSCCRRSKSKRSSGLSISRPSGSSSADTLANGRSGAATRNSTQQINHRHPFPIQRQESFPGELYPAPTLSDPRAGDRSSLPVLPPNRSLPALPPNRYEAPELGFQSRPQQFPPPPPKDESWESQSYWSDWSNRQTEKDPRKAKLNIVQL